MKNKEWFIERMGNLVYPTRLKCPCSYCLGLYDLGVHITSETQINVMVGNELEYFDSKELRKEYENTL